MPNVTLDASCLIDLRKGDLLPVFVIFRLSLLSLCQFVQALPVSTAQIGVSSPNSEVSVVTTCGQFSDRDFANLALPDFFNSRANLVGSLLNSRPRRRHQHDDRQPSIGEVLLVTHVLVRGDDDFIAFFFGFFDEFPVFQQLPIPLRGPVHGMFRQVLPKRRWSAMAE